MNIKTAFNIIFTFLIIFISLNFQPALLKAYEAMPLPTATSVVTQTPKTIPIYAEPTSDNQVGVVLRLSVEQGKIVDFTVNPDLMAEVSHGCSEEGELFNEQMICADIMLAADRKPLVKGELLANVQVVSENGAEPKFIREMGNAYFDGLTLTQINDVLLTPVPAVQNTASLTTATTPDLLILTVFGTSVLFFAVLFVLFKRTNPNSLRVNTSKILKSGMAVTSVIALLSGALLTTGLFNSLSKINEIPAELPQTGNIVVPTLSPSQYATYTWYERGFTKSAHKPTENVDCGPMDGNNDGQVDANDLSKFKNNYLQNCKYNGSTNSSICGKRDANYDQVLNKTDLYTYFVYLFYGCSYSGIPVKTPTPTNIPGVPTSTPVPTVTPTPIVISGSGLYYFVGPDVFWKRPGGGPLTVPYHRDDKIWPTGKVNRIHWPTWKNFFEQSNIVDGVIDYKGVENITRDGVGPSFGMDGDRLNLIAIGWAGGNVIKLDKIQMEKYWGVYELTGTVSSIPEVPLPDSKKINPYTHPEWFGIYRVYSSTDPEHWIVGVKHPSIVPLLGQAGMWKIQMAKLKPIENQLPKTVAVLNKTGLAVRSVPVETTPETSRYATGASLIILEVKIGDAGGLWGRTDKGWVLLRYKASGNEVHIDWRANWPTTWRI